MAPNGKPRAIVIGCGVGGLAVAYNIKVRLGFHNFVIYEREESVGGTWFKNTYPGVGCDVDSHLYSLSFNLNPNWSKRFADAPEILQYLKNTADKFGISDHVQTSTEVVRAEWIETACVWRVTTLHLKTGHRSVCEAEMLVSCVGTIGIPKDIDIAHREEYQGIIFHSAKWNHEFDYAGKRIAVVGNGCSAAQLVPKLAESAASVTQFQRSPQWINERPNRPFTAFEKDCFKYIPGWQRLFRYSIWKSTDALHSLYQSNTAAMIRARERATQDTIKYMKQSSPSKYHDILIPEFPLGCKRRIFNPGYLECLHRPNVELTTERIVEFTTRGLRTARRAMDFDAVVFSTGYKIQEFLSPIEVIGRNGVTLNEHWKDTRGAQAYKGTFVHGFPNFGIIFGPNSFPAHNSVIYTNEVQAEFFAKAVVKPLIGGHLRVIDVTQAAEMRDAQQVQTALGKMVWSGGCSNWNLDSNGRNTTNYHDPTWMFWWSLYWPIWTDFDTTGGSGRKPLHPLFEAALQLRSAVLICGLLNVLSYIIS